MHIYYSLLIKMQTMENAPAKKCPNKGEWKRWINGNASWKKINGLARHFVDDTLGSKKK